MGLIVIIGGGVMGSSIAWHLARGGAAADVTVVEPDPTYEFAATPRATGGVRLQHAIPENVQMSLHGDAVYSDFARQVTGGAVTFDPGFHRLGYLYLVRGAAAVARLEAQAAMQRGLGVEVEVLDRAALRARFPFFALPGVDAGALSPDGQIDPNAALMGYRRAAEGLGVRYVKDRVAGLDVSGGRVVAARLESGGTLPVEVAVNAANCWAPEVCAMVGQRVPIEPMRRHQFHFTAEETLPAFPAIRHVDGLAMRRHGGVYLTGHNHADEPGGFNWQVEHALFEAVLWPRLAEFCPAFERIRPRGAWVGHYDMCRLDGNPVIDWCDEVPNFLLCAGFSGHGLMHAPAVGRAVAEMILQGGFRTLDLGRFSWRRVRDGRPIADDGPSA